MGKIKLNLESGAVVEKPLINAFRANNFEYVILDNEMNGSMGLPIILVCKLDNGKLIKIEDQNEWQIVKEYLKNIIAGSQVELVKIPNVISAKDVYYTQLTLPVPSFDALKKAYTIDGNGENGEVGIADINVANNETPVTVNDPVASETPVQPVVENVTPVAPEAPAATPTNENTSVENTTAPQMETTPVVNEVPNVGLNNPSETPVVDLGISNAPVMDNPVPVNPAPEAAIDLNAPLPVFGGEINTTVTPSPSPNPTPVAPTVETPVTPTPQVEVTPVVNPTVSENEPVVSIAPESENESPFKEQKEAFMQACENMFDALVQKFEKELENKQ